uniref:Uncharacterized protein n=1 Tax=Pyramimonas obovata TaxID=1411642 RepID=A0A7S0WN35_9CHLO
MQFTTLLGFRVGLVEARSREVRAPTRAVNQLHLQQGRRNAAGTQIDWCRKQRRCLNSQFADRRVRYRSVCKASSESSDTESSAENVSSPDDKVTGPMLKQLITDKWENMHQVSINRVREGIPLINAKYFFCLEFSWHYVNQLGFDMTEEEYDKELKAVADCLNIFELSAGEVEALIKEEKKRPGTGAGGYTKNRGFEVVRIKLPVDAEGF